MKNFLGGILNPLKKNRMRVIRGDKMHLLIAVSAVAALSIILVIFLGHAEYSVIYQGDPALARQIADEIRSMGISVKTRADTVLVPGDRLSEPSMRLAVSGFASEVYDTAFLRSMSAVGVTDEDKKEYLRQLTQANIRAFINRMDKIEDCLVILTLPEDSSSNPGSDGKLAITIKLLPEHTLSVEEVESIRDAAAAGTGINRENVIISDTNAAILPNSLNN